MNKTQLKPGSNKAVLQGCSCPVIDNNHGRGCGLFDKDGKPIFWFNYDCPLHGGKSTDPVSGETVVFSERDLIE